MRLRSPGQYIGERKLGPRAGDQEDEQTRLFGFRAVHVFEVSQIDGERLPEFATVQGDPDSYEKLL